jgi:23S rRNA pseudouridine2457 synthase
MLLALNKPFGVICQFTPHPSRPSLADFVPMPNVYPAGRLDAESEGLLLLTDDGALQAKLAHPRHKAAKTYWAQVEGVPSAAQLAQLQAPLNLGDFVTLPCQAQKVDEPAWLWPRTPPVRFRANIPTSWLKIVLQEGKNRQVRRMTAAVGLPTLRLIRTQIGEYSLLECGEVAIPSGIWQKIE